ncbi:transmembrane protein, putative [Medicago truncatula]|uniref:Transmembrane protein, putative n=1 Tax=Medicago truncatula TaxID=3880 RepID=A0A072TYK5_MEDTR|nr:transmembrane protein, putative [Medicago truncatula]
MRYYTQTRLPYEHHWNGSISVTRQCSSVVNDSGNWVEPVIQMEIPRRNTRSYSFQSPDVSKLRELERNIASQDDFLERHGKLLNILQTDVTKGVLETLVQFYDCHCHCFTFPKYQLVPILEDYSHLVGLPVLNKVPFSGLEPDPKYSTIAKALHLGVSVIKDNLTVKKELSGFSTDFLYNQASFFAEAGANYAFYSVLALLIYGLVLFPHIPDFVDIRAIKWFVSYLPRPFIANRERLPWSKKIMALTPSDIIWYHPIWDKGTVIIRCGEYPNVPLIGMEGGISYNPILARRQLGYPMKTKTNSLALTEEFYYNKDDPLGIRGKFVQAWRGIHRLNRNQLGKRDDFMHESYNQWVVNQAIKNQMPYAVPKLVSATIPSSSLPLPSKTMGEYHEELADKDREVSTWKRKYDEVMVMMEDRDEIIRKHDSKILKQRQQMIERDARIQFLSTELSKFISPRERWVSFGDTRSESEE